MPLPIEYSLKNLQVRRWSVFLTAAGIALLVVVFLVVMGLADGLRQMFVSTGSFDNLVFVRQGASGPLMSSLMPESLESVRHLPQVRRDEEGQPLVSGVAQFNASLPTGRGSRRLQVTVKGVEPPAYRIEKDVALVKGRMPGRSADEVVVGVGLLRQLEGVDVGSRLELAGADLEVVGLLSSRGSAFESELWTDLYTLQRLRSRPDFNYVLAKVDVPDLAAALELEKRYESDTRSDLRIVNEARWYEFVATSSQSIRLVCYILVAVMAVAMVASGMNTMYGMVSARSREIGVLRVLGFSPRDVLVGFLLEAVAIATVGGLVGAALALLSNGLPFHYLGQQARFAIGPQLLLMGVVLGALIGLLGGLVPARRASKVEVAHALRAL
ncbi:MAG TPA: ABC transporter permease [Thermoanaerobaculia bacterium]|nr:ABC transporter permease [Thermoanaerobaculia bacterium]